MAPGKSHRFGLPLYLLPLLIGLAGILLSRQFERVVVREVIVLLSVSAPLFALGYALERYRISGRRRFIALGAILLPLGGAVMLYDLTTEYAGGGLFVAWSDVSGDVWHVSRGIGLAGLFLGLLVLLYATVRREEETGELVRQFRSLADNISEGFLVLSPDGRVLSANRSFFALTGLTPRQAAGERLGAMLPSGNHPDISVADEATIDWPTPAGERRIWLSLNPIHDGRGGFRGAIATLRDVTELHKLSERLEEHNRTLELQVAQRTEELRQSEERLSDLLMTMDEAFVTIDEDLAIHFANERMCAWLESGALGLSGESLAHYLANESLQPLKQLLKQAHLPPGERARSEVDLCSSSGQRRTVLAAVSPVRPAVSGMSEFSLVFSDVTDLKRMQHELQERAGELQRANEELVAMSQSKDNFLTNVTHELRTPLSTLRGYLEMLQSGSMGDLNENQENALAVMHRNAARLGALIEELIEFSRFEILGIQLHRGLADPLLLGKEALRAMVPEAQKRGITLHEPSSVSFPFVWCDRTRIEQALGVLLSNALKFTPEGGNIWVEVARRDPIGVVWTVRDDGIGIEPEHHARVFEKFYQVDSTLSRRYGGAGIGLAIAKTIAEAHGGKIGLDSAPGRGAAFSFHLPQALFEGVVNRETERFLRDRPVIIADDRVESCDALARRLEAWGCATQCRDNTHAALRTAGEIEDAVVLLAYGMRDMAAESALPRFSDTKAAAVVVYADQELTPAEIDVLKSEGARVLLAPFSPSGLARELQAAFNGTG